MKVDVSKAMKGLLKVAEHAYDEILDAIITQECFDCDDNKYDERKIAERLDSIGADGLFVAADKHAVVFIFCFVKDNMKHADLVKLPDFEHICSIWFSRLSGLDIDIYSVQCDVMIMNVIKEDRGFVKHVKNYLNK